MANKFRIAARLTAMIVVAGGSLTRGAPLERDLGQGLHFLRLHHLPEDLPATGVGKNTTVLDLRFLQGDTAGSTALQAWIRFNASVKTPVLILANSETGGALLREIQNQVPAPGRIIIGVASGDFHPDAAVQTTAPEERRAYDALENGADVATLVIEASEKSRNDEARLAHDHLPDSALSEELAEIPTPVPSHPPQLIDATLQRAVQLQRALLALHKISG